MRRFKTEAERAMFVAQVSCWLCVAGLAFNTLTTPVGGTWLEYALIAMCGALVIGLRSQRRKPSLAVGTTAFLLANAAVIVSLWLSASHEAAYGTWVPFRPNQLGALTIALLNPPRRWVGIVTIVGFVGSAVVQFLTFSPAIRAQLAFGDPWASLAYGGFAIALLVYGQRSTRVEQEAARAQAEAESFELFSRAMVAFRDLSNTPLQTMSNVVALLRARGELTEDLADRLDRAVHQLVELEKLTRNFEHQLRWQTGDEAWDPRSILRALADRTPNV